MYVFACTMKKKKAILICSSSLYCLSEPDYNNLSEHSARKYLRYTEEGDIQWHTRSLPNTTVSQSLGAFSIDKVRRPVAKDGFLIRSLRTVIRLKNKPKQFFVRHCASTFQVIVKTR